MEIKMIRNTVEKRKKQKSDFTNLNDAENLFVGEKGTLLRRFSYGET